MLRSEPGLAMSSADDIWLRPFDSLGSQAVGFLEATIKPQEKSYQGTMTHQQNDSHDWLGDAAENYVRYCFAREGFEVFGAGKWSTDCAVHDKETDKWYRVEVKSTDRPKRPLRPGRANLAGHADLLAEVVFTDDLEDHSTAMKLSLTRIDTNGRRSNKTNIWKMGDVREFLL